jgi:uncharacterized protein YnzC (UPF0291/DUF896 family)
MDDLKLARINELYKKSQNEGLTEEEKTEQADLRSEYVQAIRNNLRGTLNQISLLNPDGTITELTKKDKQ